MEYKRMLMEMIQELEDSDIIFLRQMYIIIKRHIEKGKSK